MIHLSFIYKGTVVQRHELQEDVPFHSNVGDYIDLLKINIPENWDRIMVTKEKLPDWVG